MRNQKSAEGRDATVFGGLEAPSKAIRAGPPELENLYFFAKIPIFRLILIKINAFQTLHQGELWWHSN